MATAPFQFKQFTIQQDTCAMKVGTDGVLLGAWAKFMNPKCILDVGTGSGLLALMMQQRFAQAEITGIDADESAFHQASGNFEEATFPEKPKAVFSAFQDFTPKRKGDAIICNPPYFKRTFQSGSASRNLARQTDKFHFSEFFSWCCNNLSNSGQLAIVFPAESEYPLGKWTYEAGLHLQEKVEVYSVEGNEFPNRSLYLWSRNNAVETQFSTLTIRDKFGSYTPEFAKLTKDFYL